MRPPFQASVSKRNATLLKRMSLLASVRLALSSALLKTAAYGHFTLKVSMVTVTLALLCHAISKITLSENHHKENCTQKDKAN